MRVVGGVNFRFRDVDECDRDEFGVDVVAKVVECCRGVDSSFGKKSSSSSSSIFDESLLASNCRMLACLRRGLMVPRIEVSRAGVFWNRVGARLTAVEPGAIGGE